MNYIKKIFKNDKDEYISFPSTDDNITCENGQKLRDVLDNFTTDDLNDTTYSKLNTTNKTVIGSINEVNDGVKKAQENQINLIEDDTSMRGISDSIHDTLNTNNKTIIGAINEVNTQCKDIAIFKKNIEHKINRLQINKGFVAHRGLQLRSPENTLKAFEEAGKFGFTMCEIDPHITSDGVWVVIHDDTIDRMTNGTGTISEMTFEQIQLYNIDNPSNVLDEDEVLKIPRFEDAIKICSYYDMGVNIDGSKFAWDKEKIEYLYSMLKKYDIDEKSFISLPNQNDRDIFLKYLPDFPICIAILSNDIDNVIQQVEKYNNVILAFQSNDLTTYAIEKCNDYNIPIYVWNAHDFISAHKWLNNGIAFVETNYILPEGSVL